MKLQISIPTPDALPAAARAFLEATAGHTIFAITGNMGAGKTTFIKALCEQLGVTSNTSSPTFSIVNTYTGKTKVYHFDLFRIQKPEELTGIGFEEYLTDRAYIFIEWPEIAITVLRDYNPVDVTISVGAHQERILEFDLPA